VLHQVKAKAPLSFPGAADTYAVVLHPERHYPVRPTEMNLYMFRLAVSVGVYHRFLGNPVELRSRQPSQIDRVGREKCLARNPAYVAHSRYQLPDGRADTPRIDVHNDKPLGQVAHLPDRLVDEVGESTRFLGLGQRLPGEGSGEGLGLQRDSRELLAYVIVKVLADPLSLNGAYPQDLKLEPPPFRHISHDPFVAGDRTLL